MPQSYSSTIENPGDALFTNTNIQSKDPGGFSAQAGEVYDSATTSSKSVLVRDINTLAAGASLIFDWRISSLGDKALKLVVVKMDSPGGNILNESITDLTGKNYCWKTAVSSPICGAAA